MSITLMRETESRLREQAERLGEDVNALANTLLADAPAGQLLEDADDLTED